VSDDTGQELLTRAAEVVGVSYPQRTVELVVMPYDSPTQVLHEGKIVTEVCSPGAFDGIERRANRIRVNRDHDVTRTVGRAIAFHPSRKEGLVAELRIARTELGEETLTLADEGILDASAGYMTMPGGVKWEAQRTLRRLTKVWLAHIAMTPDPAFTDARVLAVRSGRVNDESKTPNLDIVRAWRTEASYARLRR
jgi:HK97 family phage prohead protease